MSSIETTIERCGIEIEIVVEFSITHYGAPACWDDPGEAPEWSVERVTTRHAGLEMDWSHDLSNDEQDRIDGEIAERGDFEPDAYDDWI